jgi:hypothetical protein
MVTDESLVSGLNAVCPLVRASGIRTVLGAHAGLLAVLELRGDGYGHETSSRPGERR